MTLLRIVPAVAIMLVITHTSYAQSTFSLQTGVMQLLMKSSPPGKAGEHDEFSGKGYTIGFTATRQCTKHFRAGISVRYTARRFQYKYYSAPYIPYLPEYAYYDNRYKGNFLYLGATGDIGLGKKQVFHLAVTPAWGFLAGGSEHYYYGDISSYSSGLYTDSKTHMAKTDFRLNAQLYLAVPVGKGFCITPGIAYNFGFNSLSGIRTVRPSDLAFSLGISCTTKKHARQSTATAPADIPQGK